MRRQSLSLPAWPPRISRDSATIKTRNGVGAGGSERVRGGLRGQATLPNPETLKLHFLHQPRMPFNAGLHRVAFNAEIREPRISLWSGRVALPPPSGS